MRFIDPEEPGPLHDHRCPVLNDPGPVPHPLHDCDCRGLDGRMRDFQAGVQQKLERFESNARTS